MKNTARALAPLAVFLLAVGCTHAKRSSTERAARPGASAASPLGPDALVPSPRIVIGRVIAVDPVRAFAFVEVASDAPAEATSTGAALVARTAALHDTARLEASTHLRGRTLGTKIVSGQPTPGDEVVWLAP